jgi:hypothetical protein
MWKASDAEKAQWDGYTRLLEEKALARAKRPQGGGEKPPT